MNISVKADLSFPQRLSLRTADCGPSLGSEPEVGQSFKGSASHLTRPQSSVCPNDRRPQDSWVLFSAWEVSSWTEQPPQTLQHNNWLLGCGCTSIQRSKLQPLLFSPFVVVVRCSRKQSQALFTPGGHLLPPSPCSPALTHLISASSRSEGSEHKPWLYIH